MAPLSLEIYKDGNWSKVGEIKPGDPTGSISDNTETGREIYLFECSPDDLGSVIYRSKGGIDKTIGSERQVIMADDEIIKELQKGDAPYEMEIKTDISTESKRIRFTHI